MLSPYVFICLSRQILYKENYLYENTDSFKFIQIHTTLIWSVSDGTRQSDSNNVSSLSHIAEKRLLGVSIKKNDRFWFHKSTKLTKTMIEVYFFEDKFLIWDRIHLHLLVLKYLLKDENNFDNITFYLSASGVSIFQETFNIYLTQHQRNKKFNFVGIYINFQQPSLVIKIIKLFNVFEFRKINMCLPLCHIGVRKIFCQENSLVSKLAKI